MDADIDRTWEIWSGGEKFMTLRQNGDECPAIEVHDLDVINSFKRDNPSIFMTEKTLEALDLAIQELLTAEAQEK